MLLVIFLVICSAFVSGAETALFSLPHAKVKTYATHADRPQRLIADLVQRPRELLVTLLSVNIIVNIAIQNVISTLAGPEASWLWKVGCPLLLTLIFGEIFPKSIAFSHNEKIAAFAAPLVFHVRNLLAPLLRYATKATSYISSALFFFLKSDADITKEEMNHLLETSENQGVLNSEESKLIRGYLRLQESTAKESMRPRHEILWYEWHEPISTLTALFVDQECTRVPVCHQDLQHIKGIISATDFFLHQASIKEGKDLLPLLTKPFYVPENAPTNTLRRQLSSRHAQLAIVTDEYGAISGLISREDLIEIVVGDIADRRDLHHHYSRSSAEEIIAEGDLELSEFREIFGVELESQANMVTLAGWLIEQIGTIPRSGTIYETETFYFQVLEAEPKRIRKIYVRIKEPQKGEIK